MMIIKLITLIITVIIVVTLVVITVIRLVVDLVIILICVIMATRIRHSSLVILIILSIKVVYYSCYTYCSS